MVSWRLWEGALGGIWLNTSVERPVIDLKCLAWTVEMDGRQGSNLTAKTSLFFLTSYAVLLDKSHYPKTVAFFVISTLYVFPIVVPIYLIWFDLIFFTNVGFLELFYKEFYHIPKIFLMFLVIRTLVDMRTAPSAVDGRIVMSKLNPPEKSFGQCSFDQCNCDQYSCAAVISAIVIIDPNAALNIDLWIWRPEQWAEFMSILNICNQDPFSNVEPSIWQVQLHREIGNVTEIELKKT